MKYVTFFLFQRIILNVYFVKIRIVLYGICQKGKRLNFMMPYYMS